jgi:hypothetical protein
LINLTPQERQALSKMGSATQSFVSMALEIASNNPQFDHAGLNSGEAVRKRDAGFFWDGQRSSEVDSPTSKL